jgi:hypothetical protein
MAACFAQPQPQTMAQSGLTRSTPTARAALGKVVTLLHPGSFVLLHDHPHDLPPFQLIQCQGGRCWVRQQAWGRGVHWEVPHRRLLPAG